MREIYGGVHPTNEDKKKVIITFFNERDKYLRENRKELTSEGYKILDKLYEDNKNNILRRLNKGNNIEKLARELIEVVMKSDCMKNHLVNEVSENALG